MKAAVPVNSTLLRDDSTLQMRREQDVIEHETTRISEGIEMGQSGALLGRRPQQSVKVRQIRPPDHLELEAFEWGVEFSRHDDGRVGKLLAAGLIELRQRR